MKRTCFFIILLLICSFASSAQELNITQKDSSVNKHFLTIQYEKNGRKKSFKKSTITITANKKEHLLTEDSNHRFLVDFPIDTTTWTYLTVHLGKHLLKGEAPSKDLRQNATLAIKRYTHINRTYKRSCRKKRKKKEMNTAEEICYSFFENKPEGQWPEPYKIASIRQFEVNPELFFETNSNQAIDISTVHQRHFSCGMTVQLVFRSSELKRRFNRKTKN